MTQQQFESNKGFQTGIWHKGKLVGVVGFHPIDWMNFKASIGYWLSEDHQGKGIVTKACEVYLKHAFENLKLNKVEIRCATENKKSRVIPERLNFKLDGVIRQSECLYGRFVDHAVYSILASEWSST